MAALWWRLVPLLLTSPWSVRGDELSDAIAATRRSLCGAFIHEMHIEIHKFSLRKQGEDEIYESVPAMCLAIMQNYTLTRTKMRWKLSRRLTRLDDDEDPKPSAVKYLSMLKQVCSAFAEDLQQDISELMYKHTGEAGTAAAEIEAQFCDGPDIQKPHKPPKTPRGRPSGEAKHRQELKQSKQKQPKQKRPTKGSASEDSAELRQLLEEYDTDGTIREMIVREDESPESMLEAAQLEQVQIGARQLRCAACGALVKVVQRRARKQQALHDETRLQEITSAVCLGTMSAQKNPKYPGNPPLWVEMYSVRQAADGEWTMGRLPKGAQLEEKSEEFDRDQLTMKHAMISRSCKMVLEEAEDDLAVLMYGKPSQSFGDLRARFCEDFCDGKGSAGKKDEL